MRLNEQFSAVSMFIERSCLQVGWFIEGSPTIKRMTGSDVQMEQFNWSSLRCGATQEAYDL